VSSPSDRRYAALLEQLVTRLEPLMPGIGVLVVPARQQEIIAATLATLLAAEVVDLERAAAPTPASNRWLVAGLPNDSIRAAKLLAELNGRRNVTAAQGRLVVLVVSPWELVHVQRHAPDTFSALRFLESVPFVPDPEVRGLSGGGSAPPLKTVDAVRLLGPLALQMVRAGRAAIVEEGALRAHIERALSTGIFRGVTGADEVIALFRNTLGLLVEQAPGVYAFLHLTLAEYFAAWELVRTDELERLAADPTRAYWSQYREVLLLSAGELGVSRGDDVRLANLVDTLLGSAAQRTGRPSPMVPSLRSGLLADDPHLPLETARKIIDELIPKWWFGRAYGRAISLLTVVQEATRMLHDRIMRGRLGPLVHAAAQRAYGSGFPSTPDVLHNLTRGGPIELRDFLHFLIAAGVDYGPHFLVYQSLSQDRGPGALRIFFIPLRLIQPDTGAETMRAQFQVSRQIEEKVRSGELQLDLTCRLRVTKNQRILLLQHKIPWEPTLRVVEPNDVQVTLEIPLPLKRDDPRRPGWGVVLLERRSAADGAGE
jgi:hypothetical protein